jgi:AcrR family transcriptional regulator
LPAPTQVAVAAAAGVRQSHLTYYFAKREDLLEAVAGRAVGEIACEVGRAVARSGSRDDLLGVVLGVAIPRLMTMKPGVDGSWSIVLAGATSGALWVAAPRPGRAKPSYRRWHIGTRRPVSRPSHPAEISRQPRPCVRRQT